MRENGFEVERSKKYKLTTDSNHAFNIAPNLLNRDFRADQPNQKWAGDISGVQWARTNGGQRLGPGRAVLARDRLARQQSHKTRLGDPGFVEWG